MRRAPSLTCSRGLTEAQRWQLIQRWLEPLDAWDAASGGPRGHLVVVWDHNVGTMTYTLLRSGRFQRTA